MRRAPEPDMFHHSSQPESDMFHHSPAPDPFQRGGQNDSFFHDSHTSLFDQPARAAIPSTNGMHPQNMLPQSMGEQTLVIPVRGGSYNSAGSQFAGSRAGTYNSAGNQSSGSKPGYPAGLREIGAARGIMQTKSASAVDHSFKIDGHSVGNANSGQQNSGWQTQKQSSGLPAQQQGSGWQAQKQGANATAQNAFAAQNAQGLSRLGEREWRDLSWLRHEELREARWLAYWSTHGYFQIPFSSGLVASSYLNQNYFADQNGNGLYNGDGMYSGNGMYNGDGLYGDNGMYSGDGIYNGDESAYNDGANEYYDYGAPNSSYGNSLAANNAMDGTSPAGISNAGGSYIPVGGYWPYANLAWNQNRPVEDPHYFRESHHLLDHHWMFRPYEHQYSAEHSNLAGLASAPHFGNGNMGRPILATEGKH